MSDAGDERDEEMEVLETIFPPDELTILTTAPYYFAVTLTLDGPVPSDLDPAVDTAVADDGGGVVCKLTFSLPLGYPQALPLELLSLDCGRIAYPQVLKLTEAVHSALPVDGEVKVWEYCEWIKENACRYFNPRADADADVDPGTGAAPAALVGGDGGAAAAAGGAGVPPNRGGFMREWCSFVSLYEQSYCKGDTRFVVMCKLARDRGLNITGMGIAGKPGGLVAEGEETDVVAFMRLMRTEFFETLNPRGRKLTTRLQDRWPLDAETERFEVAEIVLRRSEDVYRTADRAAGKIKKRSEVARLAAWESKDLKVVEGWEKQNAQKRSHKGGGPVGAGISMSLREAQRLVEVGKPATCTVPGVYKNCGLAEPPPARDEIEAQRLFSDFTIFQGKEVDASNGVTTGKQVKTYGQGSKEAGNLFRELGREDGFDAMFTYRFS